MSDDAIGIPLPFRIELSKKKKINEIRIIHDEFKICIPKIVYVQKWLFGEKTKIVNYKENGIFEMDLK